MAAGKKIGTFLASHPPFDLLDAQQREALAAAATVLRFQAGDIVYGASGTLAGLYCVASGAIEIRAAEGSRISAHHRGDTFGGQALLKNAPVGHEAICVAPARVYLLPRANILPLIDTVAAFGAFFSPRPLRPRPSQASAFDDPSRVPIADLMIRDPITIAPTARVEHAARIMHEKGISSVLVSAGTELAGILTTADMTRLIAEGRTGAIPVSEAMTAQPITLSPDAVGFDAFLLMLEHNLGHLPIVEDGRAIGIVTQTSLLRRRQASSLYLIGEISRCNDRAALAKVVARTPQLLSRLVGAGVAPHVVTRLITHVTDALTRRLVALAQARLGPPPVPYLWLACGSQGRCEQTGVSDQDNCLILHNDVRPEHDAYFADLARLVCDGLNACGFVYCPGDMMASVDKWRQPVRIWRDYFHGWIKTPDPMAQMLASVMFDLRPIVGDETLFAGLHEETLAAARENSIFIAHMVANSLKHHPPLGLFRNFALIRSAEHKDTVDLKLGGVIPVTDLGRLYALMGGLSPVNTRKRLVAARKAGVISGAGAHDLLDAYDFIAETRLRHQARQIRRDEAPDNFMHPATLSELERAHLKNAFAVVKTMQSAAAQGRGHML